MTPHDPKNVYVIEINRDQAGVIYHKELIRGFFRKLLLMQWVSMEKITVASESDWEGKATAVQSIMETYKLLSFRLNRKWSMNAFTIIVRHWMNRMDWLRSFLDAIVILQVVTGWDRKRSDQSGGPIQRRQTHLSYSIMIRGLSIELMNDWGMDSQIDWEGAVCASAIENRVRGLKLTEWYD